MKKMNKMLLAAGLIAFLGNPGMAQENEKTEKKDSVRTISTTVRIEKPEDLQKVLGAILGSGGSVTVKKDSSATAKKDTTGKTEGKTPRQDWWAKSIINQKAPELHVERWVGEEPDRTGKFTFLYFWDTTCGPCIKKIPTLNEWNKMFKDEMVMIGVAPDDSVERMENAGKPKIEFYRAVDFRRVTANAIENHVNSYVLLIDPDGIVRLEDVANNITPEIIRGVLDKYGKKK